MISCKCCGNYTVSKEHDICPVCFWEKDYLDEANQQQSVGPNRISLVEARKHYRQFGASERRFVSLVRDPKFKELPANHKNKPD